MNHKAGPHGTNHLIRLLGCVLLLLLHTETAFAAATDTVQPERPMEMQEKLKAAYLAKGLAYRPRTAHFNEDGSPRYINRLILEDSPYLLQHAHNPVDWYPWSQEAFDRARREQKPVFLSIGYATCHWCHVMERESFEDPAIAALLNEHFIAIKVDRETHPDIDQVYMTAVTLLTGHGGWPMSSFLTPQGKPFFGGTYFPPAQFTSLIEQVSQVWRERRDEVEAQAEQIALAVAENNRLKAAADSLDPSISVKAVAVLGSIFDEIQGGFGQAPKFPQEPWLFLLLDQAERRQDRQALTMLDTSLDHMARGGIYDQAGGGFHRYSTDYEWLVPHFEKMLYNQAHLARIYLGAARLTGKTQYRRVVTQTLDYVLREMTSPGGGFYSATDADSEGEEGLFFTWTPAEIRDALAPEDADLAKALYGISRIGNFEGRNILHLEQGLEAYAAAHQLDLPSLRQRIDHINNVLLKVRNQRVPPLLDDKIITAWNGMMITAFAQAADLLDEPAYRQAAEKAAEFIWQHNRRSAGKLWRVHLDGRSSVIATLEDYAYLGEAMLSLYDLTGDDRWLTRAAELADALTSRFMDNDHGGFFMNESEADITAMGRPRDDGADGAIPSGSAVALHLLQGLWQRTGQADYGDRVEALIGRFAASINEQPHGYGYMLTAINQYRQGALGERQYAAQGGIRLKGKLTPGAAGALGLRVEIHIPQGWHINSSQPDDPDLIPTRLSLQASAQGWSLGPVTYPPGESQQLAFQTKPQSLYTGPVTIEVMLHPQADAPVWRTVPMTIDLQACNDQLCLPPEQVRLSLALP